MEKDNLKWNLATFFFNHLKASVFSNSVSKSVSLWVASPISIAKPVLCSEYPGGAETLARVSAPPGYSEHSTGFAIDIGDATQRETDFETEFENTDAFKWLKKNVAKFHFKLSFSKDNKYIDYEPWHWRYEGSIEALKVFESSNRKS